MWQVTCGLCGKRVLACVARGLFWKTCGATEDEESGTSGVLGNNLDTVISKTLVILISKTVCENLFG